MAGAGRGRPAQDHPVDPLPHDRHRPPAVDRPRLPVPQRRRRLPAVATPPASTWCPNFDVRPRAADRAHPHRRHRPADVDGRAHHPARHRQRHVAADLRLGRVAAARATVATIKAETGRPPWSWSSPDRSSCILVAIVFVEQGQRRIPVQFAKRVVGRRMYGGQSTYIPLKVNQAGVIPIIFASSVLYLPLLLVARPAGRRAGAQSRPGLDQRQPRQARLDPIYLVVLRPADHRVRLLLHGDHVRPGQAGRHDRASRAASSPASGPAPRPSATWPRCLNRITLPGALFIAAIALVPAHRARARPRRPAASVLVLRRHSILIAVGVALETMKQIDSQLMMRNYEGFLK